MMLTRIIPFEQLRELATPELHAFVVSREVASEMEYPADAALGFRLGQGLSSRAILLEAAAPVRRTAGEPREHS
jgi:hypothetical protein